MLKKSIDSVSLMARGACFKRERIDGTLESLMLLLVLLVEGTSSNSVSLGWGSGSGSGSPSRRARAALPLSFDDTCFD